MSAKEFRMRSTSPEAGIVVCLLKQTIITIICLQTDREGYNICHLALMR